MLLLHFQNINRNHCTKFYFFLFRAYFAWDRNWIEKLRCVLVLCIASTDLICQLDFQYIRLQSVSKWIDVVLTFESTHTRRMWVCVGIAYVTFDVEPSEKKQKSETKNVKYIEWNCVWLSLGCVCVGIVWHGRTQTPYTTNDVHTPETRSSSAEQRQHIHRARMATLRTTLCVCICECWYQICKETGTQIRVDRSWFRDRWLNAWAIYFYSINVSATATHFYSAFSQNLQFYSGRKKQNDGNSYGVPGPGAQALNRGCCSFTCIIWT